MLMEYISPFVCTSPANGAFTASELIVTIHVVEAKRPKKL